VCESVRKTGKVLVVHEDTRTGGFAAEIIAEIASQCFTDLDAPPERLTTPDLPIPYNTGMMNAIIPSTQAIRIRIKALLDY
jgi:2-oxoisovalerate dehydrogenase E1 component